MLRDIRRPEQMDPQTLFTVQTKARVGHDYPAFGNVLPVVYTTQMFNLSEHTVRVGTREDYAWAYRWQPEGTDLVAVRVNGQLFAIPKIFKYCVRSYDMDGNTQWMADYWEGSTGEVSGNRLGVCIDSSGNVYVCGMTATSPDGTQHWSLISYDSSGNERWRKDLRAMGRALSPANSSYTGNMRDICCTADDRIVVIGDRYNSSSIGGTFDISMWIFNPDGTLATTPTLEFGGTLPKLRVLAVGNKVALLPLNGHNGTIVGCARGTKYLTDAGQNQVSGSTFYIYPTLVQLPAFDRWSVGTQEWGYWGCIEGLTTETASISTVAVSEDNSKVYCSGPPGINAKLGGSTVTRNIMRLIPDIAYAQPGSSTNPSQNTIIWGLTGPERTASAGIPGAVVMAGGGVPRIQAYADADGSSVWAHNHLNIHAMQRRGSSLLTVGGREDNTGDESFV